MGVAEGEAVSSAAGSSPIVAAKVGVGAGVVGASLFLARRAVKVIKRKKKVIERPINSFFLDFLGAGTDSGSKAGGVGGIIGWVGCGGRFGSILKG